MAEIINEFPEGYAFNFTWRGNGAEVADLPVYRIDHSSGAVQSVSAWRLSAAELEEVNRTGLVYISVFGPHPPVYVHTGLEFQTSTFREHLERQNAARSAATKVWISVPHGFVLGPVVEGFVPGTPHRVGHAVEVVEGEWRVVEV